MSDWDWASIKKSANPVRYHVVPLHGLKPFPSSAFADLVAKETDAAIAAIQRDLAKKLVMQPYGCSFTFTREEMEAAGAKLPPRPDPLDVKHDGVTLRRLLEMDENRRREHIVGAIISPAQRAAISAHWSAELRAKVAASAERERSRVRVDPQDEP